MKFWTFQRKNIVDKLAAGLTIRPCWTDGAVTITGCSLDAYRYLLNRFNEDGNRKASGLIFGYADYESSEQLYKAIDNAGWPSGASFRGETHALIECNIPDQQPKITIDFYRFSDLLFAFAEGDLGDLTLEQAKRDLNKPNGKQMELPVTHIECLRPEWVKSIHKPKGEDDVPDEQ